MNSTRGEGLHFMGKIDNFQSLREQAEKLLADGGDRDLNADQHDLLRVVHELEVHQMELELQNRELRRTQAELEASRDEFATLYESAPVGYVTLNAKGLIERANTEARGLLGSKTVEGTPFSNYLEEDDFGVYYDFLNQLASRKRHSGSVEVRISRPEEKACVQLEAQTEFDESGAVKHRRLCLVDITERMRAQKMFQGTFENAAVGMAHVSRDGIVLQANRKLCEILGYSNEELCGKHFRLLTHAEDLEKDLLLMEQLSTGRIEQYSIEKRFYKKDGHIVWGRLTASMQSPEIAIGVLEDITERKRLEQDLWGYQNELEKRVAQRTEDLETESERRRYLAEQLVNLLEGDRRTLSKMLHDDVGQHLVGLKMELENFQRDLRKSQPTMSGHLDHALESFQEIIGSLRDWSRQLRPTALDILGLVAALRTLGDGKQTEKCTIDFSFNGVPKTLDSRLEIAIFRIAQEAVTNAIRHAGCGKLHIALMGRDNTLFLSIEDDGCGFAHENGKRESLGLVIMRERAINAGGELRVESSPGKGTTVMAEFPVSVPKEA